LRAQAALVVDADGPEHNQGIAGPAKMGANAFAPLEGSVSSPGPTHRIMRRGRWSAEFIEDFQHVCGGLGHAVDLCHGVRGAVKPAFKARAVVSGNENDERVVQLSGFAKRFDDASDLVIRLR